MNKKNPCLSKNKKIAFWILAFSILLITFVIKIEVIIKSKDTIWVVPFIYLSGVYAIYEFINQQEMSMPGYTTQYPPKDKFARFFILVAGVIMSIVSIYSLWAWY